MTESKYPEHARLHEVKDESQALGEFLECLNGMGLTLCELNTESFTEGRYFPTSRSTQDILAQFFGIDLKKIDQEKKQMLDNIRRGNQQERDLND